MEEMTPEQFNYILQFIHIEKLLSDFPGVNDETVSSIVGIDAKTYRDARNIFDKNALAAAEDLLSDSEFAVLVDTLPFEPNSLVMGVGDSVTDDDQSWLHILKHLLAIRRPDDNIQIINAGISQETTTHVISRFSQLSLAKPDWLIFMIGLNDARRHGNMANKTLVSPEESEKNLAMLQSFASAQTSAKRIWMTPTKVDESKISAHWLLSTFQTTWENEDIAAIAEHVKALPDKVIDLQAVFGSPVNPEYLLEDGLHPSLQGQKQIVKTLVENLNS